MKADPPKDAKCRDKFLVQSVNIPADQEFSSLQEVVRDAAYVAIPGCFTETLT